MKTLYDVLNIRADDGAESVRKAFLKAVKANHPDLHPGDPDAQSRFAQIVRANAILRNPKLRAIYDGILESQAQQRRRSKLVTLFNTAHRIVADAIIGFVLAFVLAEGGYKLFTYLSKTSDVTARGSVTVAAVPPLMQVDAARHLKAVGLPKSSAAALGPVVDVAANANTAVEVARADHRRRRGRRSYAGLAGRKLLPGRCQPTTSA
jgi:curved DNA-binding protein CbpA